MGSGKNDFVTKECVEQMIAEAIGDLRVRVKELQDDNDQLDIDFVGLNEKLKQLEQPDTEIQDRLNKLIEQFCNYEFVTGVIQSESGTRLSTCQDSAVNDESLSFVVSGLRLPVAINHLILSVLKYVLNGKQD